MRNNFVFGPLAAAFLFVVAAACSDESDTVPGCTPGAQTACACPNGVEGIQVCASDGRSLGECDCGGIPDTCGDGNVDAGEECDDGNTTNDDDCSNACTTPICGDGIIQAGEDCDDQGATGEFDECPDNCQNGGTGGAGGGGVGGGGTGGAGGGGPTCNDVVMFAGIVPTQQSVWTSNGLTGFAAGMDLCDGMFLGSHVCDYTELLAAEAKPDAMEPQLGLLATNTTLWVNRTTPEMVNNVTSQPGAGGRCNDWTYATNHASDGEFAVVTAPSDLTFHLDGDTVFMDPGAGNTSPHVVAGDLDCGGTFRAIPCCNPCTP